MRSSEDFWDSNAKKYAKSPIKNMAAYEKTLERVRTYLSEGDTVLEVGCGTGSTALLLAGNVKQITGVDISSNMVGIASGKARDQRVENVSFVHGTAFDDTLQKGSFDVVMAFSFLHLQEDMPGTIRRIRELLKPGGLFISKTVCLREKTRLLGVLIYLMQKVGYAPFVESLSYGAIDEAIAAEGFEIIETGIYPPPARFVVAKKA